MTLANVSTPLYEQLNSPDNPAFQYINDAKEILSRDVWDIRQDLPALASYAQIYGQNNIYFTRISLPWLKELTKIAVLVGVGNQRWSLGYVKKIVSAVNDLSSWLVEQGYFTISTFNIDTIQKWNNRKNFNQITFINRLTKVLRTIDCIDFQISCKREYVQKAPRIITEDVKHKIDIALEQLDPPIYLIFKCHEALGTRSIEIANIPLDCLRLREGIYKVRLWTGKQNGSFQEQDLPEELVPLIRKHQDFITRKFGQDFPWLFSNWGNKKLGQKAKKFSPTFEYYPEQNKQVCTKLNLILKRLIEHNNIRTEDGELAHVTTHMFRKTFATVAHRMGKRPDQIQHGLRHLNLDMQDSYVKVTPQELSTERVLVDKNGFATVYRTDQDSDFLGKEWRTRQVYLGVCSRPSIQVKCQYEYACMECSMSRYGIEHLPRLLEDRQYNQALLERCLAAEQSDSGRAKSARRLIAILNRIIESLQNIDNQSIENI